MCYYLEGEDEGVVSEQFDNATIFEERKKLEKLLLRKLDRRMSILVLIYILNCTSSYPSSSRNLRLIFLLGTTQTLTEIMLRDSLYSIERCGLF